MELRRTWWLTALLLLGGCGGGSELWRQSDFPYADAFPFVVKFHDPVDGLDCSGTMLSPTTLLTAAHCVSREGRFIVVAPQGVTSAHEIARLGRGGPEDTGDLVLLRTEDPIVSAKYPAVGQSLHVGERVRLAGFGCRDFESDTGGGVEQVGWNQVNYVSDFAYLLTPLHSARGLVGQEGGEKAGLCYGDSGAPAFRESEKGDVLVGIGHGAARTTDEHVSYYVDVTQSAQRVFLEEASRRLDAGIQFEP